MKIYIHSQHKYNIQCNINDIILLFSDTVSRSGVYCVVSNAIEQCKTEGVVDVFQATKAVRIHKPGAVTTLVSIHLCMFEVRSIEGLRGKEG